MVCDTEDDWHQHVPEFGNLTFFLYRLYVPMFPVNRRCVVQGRVGWKLPVKRWQRRWASFRNGKQWCVAIELYVKYLFGTENRSMRLGLIELNMIGNFSSVSGRDAIKDL